MLIQSPQPKFVERILTDAQGRQFRVLFAVSLINGEVRGRIISATEIKSIHGQGAVTVCLAGNSNKNIYQEILSAFTPVTSPYFSLEYLLNSQPTRAPSHN